MENIKCPHCKKDIEVKKNVFQHPLILDGKEFAIPNWNYGKHMDVVRKVKDVVKMNKGDPYTQEEKNRFFETFLILRGMEDVDPTFSENKLNQFHPNDRLELYMALYMAGKRGIGVMDKSSDAGNFRKKTK